MDEKQQLVVPVEVRLRQGFSGSTDQIEKNVRETIAQQCPIIRLGPVDFSKNSFLCQNVEQIAFTDLDEIAPDSDVILLWQVQLDIYMYSCEESGATEDADNGGEEGDNTPSCMQWTLPNNELEGSWENLIYEVGLKRRLLNYVKSALLFSERGVNPHIIGCNRLVLLHGPPGTGKTSLARALAHKLSIRMGKIYASGGMLLEINAHSLFSKWFSESGKLVMKLFQHIQEIVEDEELFVVLLIDEVESLSASRQNAMSGSEPTDAIRVVNALLTQIDALKTKKNVLIITTSNITQAIDAAFLDRADIRQFIGHPIAAGRYSIFASCVSELVRTGIISVEEEQSKDKAIQKDQEVKQEDGQRKGKSKQSSSQSKQKTQSHSRPNSSSRSTQEQEISSNTKQNTTQTQSFSILPFKEIQKIVSEHSTLSTSSLSSYQSSIQSNTSSIQGNTNQLSVNSLQLPSNQQSPSSQTQIQTQIQIISTSPFSQSQLPLSSSFLPPSLPISVRASAALRDIALMTDGFSGRTLRKLPFLAHSEVMYLSSSLSGYKNKKKISTAMDKQKDGEESDEDEQVNERKRAQQGVDVFAFLNSLYKAVITEKREKTSK